MNEADFHAMTLKELRAYVLSHRDEDLAFYTYMDRARAEENWIAHPPLKSIEDMKNYPEVIERMKRDGKSEDRESNENAG